MSDELAALDAVAQAELVATGQVSPLELVDAAIARIEAVNPRLNAVIHERFEKARTEAAGDLPAGPLRGVPMVVKDLDGMTAGDPCHNGSVHLQRAGYVGDHDSELQARFKAAGLVILGRTNTPELGLLPTTEPVAHGPSRNPWDPNRSTGGSSGGSAAAVAARMVPLGHAGDGGGSIRIPASECGLVGLMPSRGRTSVGPEADEAWGGFVRRHVVTRTVRDTAAVLDAVHGWRPGDPYTAPTPTRPFAAEVDADPGRLRIGVLTASPSPYVEVHPACAEAVEHVAGLLDAAGHDVHRLPGWLLDADEQARLNDGFATAYAAFAAEEVRELAAMTGTPVEDDGIEPTTRFVAGTGAAISATDYLEAMRSLSRVTRHLAGWWTEGNDVLLSPTLALPPPELGWFTCDEPLQSFINASNLTAFTAVWNVTGQPAISLPLFEHEGLPIGVQLVAAYGREDRLLQVAGQLERRAPWVDRLPPIHA